MFSLDCTRSHRLKKSLKMMMRKTRKIERMINRKKRKLMKNLKILIKWPRQIMSLSVEMLV
jgi:hypothetical protein